MGIDRPKFKQLIKEFKFKELFNELGWNYVKKEIPLSIDEKPYLFRGIAEKQQFIILECVPQSGSVFPDSATRKKMDREISKLFLEHLIIFVDSEKTKQIWQLCIRQANKPLITHEVTLYSHQAPDIILQKLSGLLFTLEEEGNIGLVDVVRRVSEVFDKNADKVTKKFYDQFRKEHQTFLKFIEGIDSVIERDWYASLMLNRLMFIYFIQKKGFLDKNENYLRDKLDWSQKRKGKDNFYSFYRDFLLMLFHKGLGNSVRNQQLLEEIGEIPYLNGGLFDEHHIEKDNSIKIPDGAFENIFNFFDQYNWHLDYRATATGKDINPDVIGYIFEKYINDRAAMGAYYTKEDITGYISKNTIIPFLFDEVKKQCATAFQDDSSLWKMLQDDPDRYIYDAVKYGIYDENGDVRPLPPEIEIGVDTTRPNLLERRKDWNKKAPQEYGLPTEIWREYVERRQRYFDIREKITNGDIREINDFITYNLNITQFAQDSVENYEGSDFIIACSKAIRKITILDPTCGSGAFLFAAMNILEPLYETCIKRMREFVEEDDAGNGRKYPRFRETLATIEYHPNEKYYIFKSIILNNLYGVDIMNEAVEIAKLRLFLKLAATVEVDYSKKNMGLEPLPDLDFNIRCGNTLVGFATKDEIDKIFSEKLDLYNTKDKIYEKMDVVAHAFQRFKEIQLSDSDVGHDDFHKAKGALEDRLAELNDDLNRYLASEYGIDADKKPQGYEKWKSSHQPFHWLAEFYEIIHGNGGFDVIIGNPPYVEYSKIRNRYRILSFNTIDSGNIYAFIIERSLSLLKDKSYISMIIQLSAFCTPRMISFQDEVEKKTSHLFISFYDDRPGKLFDGLEHIRVAIFIGKKHICNQSNIYTTTYNKFYSIFRPYLFDSLKYIKNINPRYNWSFIKISSNQESQIVHKINQIGTHITDTLNDKKNKNYVYYGYGYGYWGKILNFKSFFKGEKIEYSTGDKYLYIRDSIDNNIIVSLMNSNLFYWYYVNFSDGHNFTKTVIGAMPFKLPNKNISDQLCNLCIILMNDLSDKSSRKSAYYKSTGKVEYDEFYPKLSKSIIDDIDKVLAEHYGFTEEELDFIINYDIKYRMGGELEV